jgi:hypothetical protein
VRPTHLVSSFHRLCPQADHTSVVKALYDYEASAPGELSITEDQILHVFDTEDDWLLVQTDEDGGKAGFVPANYVEATSGEEEAPAPQIVVPSSVRLPITTLKAISQPSSPPAPETGLCRPRDQSRLVQDQGR